MSETNTSPLDRHNQARNRLQDVAGRLETLADAFLVVGNPDMHDRLEWHAGTVSDAAKAADDAFSEVLRQAHASVQESSGNMIRAALAAADLAHKSDETAMLALRLCRQYLYRFQHSLGNYGGSPEYCNLFDLCQLALGEGSGDVPADTLLAWAKKELSPGDDIPGLHPVR